MRGRTAVPAGHGSLYGEHMGHSRRNDGCHGVIADTAEPKISYGIVVRNKGASAGSGIWAAEKLRPARRPRIAEVRPGAGDRQTRRSAASSEEGPRAPGGGFIGPCAQGGWGDTLGPRAEERGLIVLEVRAEARSHASKKRFGDVPQSLGRSYATGRTSF